MAGYIVIKDRLKKELQKILGESKKLTKDKAYILGVLCGDGYVTTNYRLGLNVCDLDFIKEFNKCIKLVYGLTLKIKERNRRKTNFKSNPKVQYCVLLASKNVYFDLIRYGSFKSEDWIIPKDI